MRLSKRVSVLVFGLLLGGIVSWGAKASADETPSEVSTLEIQRPEQSVSVTYLTAVSLDIADAELPDGVRAPAVQVARVRVRHGAGHWYYPSERG